MASIDNRLRVTVGQCAPCLLERPEYEVEAVTMYNGVALCPRCLEKFARQGGTVESCGGCGSREILGGHCVHCGASRKF